MWVESMATGSLGDVLGYVSLLSHLEQLTKGLFHLQDGGLLPHLHRFLPVCHAATGRGLPVAVMRRFSWVLGFIGGFLVLAFLVYAGFVDTIETP